MAKKLYRSQNDKMLTGLCGGMADYFDMDVSMMRLIWVLGTLLLTAGFGGLFIYLIASIVVPVEPV
ncbi:PspC domain-containing protein [Metallumcola ferriviriculae]|uniref:PspC domain-containing protein n=1 Tax=Metallumcola ferriviriculae TaxID=3039180 RepID=A0AAU0ULM9_9FIRM|nr:PspC domain-containing protein [Desulfitibacteraceae bacterium MK1]